VHGVHDGGGTKHSLISTQPGPDKFGVKPDKHVHPLEFVVARDGVVLLGPHDVHGIFPAEFL